ncbi:MAG TPA: type II toxin-antitoxin system RelE/ParE family toxin [Parvibaculum sp.]
MTYRLEIDEDALKEWRRLDGSVRTQFEKKLAKVLENPRIPASALAGMKDCYKIKLRKAGMRLVYRVEDAIVTVIVIAVGKRDKSAVYETVLARLKSSGL